MGGDLVHENGSGLLAAENSSRLFRFSARLLQAVLTQTNYVISLYDAVVLQMLGIGAFAAVLVALSCMVEDSKHRSRIVQEFERYFCHATAHVRLC